jgi:hypothetical protein
MAHAHTDDIDAYAQGVRLTGDRLLCRDPECFALDPMAQDRERIHLWTGHGTPHAVHERHTFVEDGQRWDVWRRVA